MKLPKELTIATPLSKYLAMVVFISLPIVGFFFGMRYQEMVDLTKRQKMEANLSIPRAPTPTPIAIPTVDPSITANWKTYRNEKYGFETKYHPELNVIENVGNETVGQFAYLLLIRFEKSPISFPHGYELRINKQSSLDDYSSELIGHITDKIDSVEEILVNGNKWTKITYEVYVTTDYTPITTAFTYHAGYGYAITSSSLAIDQILSTFQFLP